MEATRTIAIPGFATSLAQSDPDTSFATAQVRLARLSDFGSWYAKPMIDARWTYLDRNAVVETGASTANLWVSASDDTYFAISLAVEFGTQYGTEHGAAVKPFLKTAMTYLADTHSSLPAGFIAADPGMGGFTIEANVDDLFADIEAGIQLFNNDGSSLTFGYKDMISENTRQNGVFAKGMMKF